MNPIEALRAAFGARREPERLWVATTSPGERREMESFRGLDWTTLTCDHLVENFSALFHFSPEAFAYFLPRILAAGIREGRVDLLAYDVVVGDLDRSPRPDYWNESFADRWAPLSREECRAVQSWLLWLMEADGEARFENTFDRAFDTLTLLGESSARERGGPRSDGTTS